MRVVFIGNYWHLVNVEDVPYAEIIKGFIKAIPLDIATSCFIMLLPSIVLFVGVTINKNFDYRWVRWYFYFMISLYILTVMGEIGIYGEWRTKLSYKALVICELTAGLLNGRL